MPSLRSFFLSRHGFFLALFIVGSAGLALYFIHPVVEFYKILIDREAVKSMIEAWGAGAPLAFILVQVFQVILAPVPGEISGFVGGYLFGAGYGFIYSTIALTIGSAANFWIGRFLGYRFIRKLIPANQLQRMDGFLTHQGLIMILAFFIFPGFPKDYLSLFLGGTAMPFKVFILMAGLGRMPGTLMLSLQGGFVFQQMYGLYVIILGVSLVMMLLAIYYRKAIYGWAERFNKR